MPTQGVRPEPIKPVGGAPARSGFRTGDGGRLGRVADIAAALGLTPEEVRLRAHRMKRRFRDFFERLMAKGISSSNNDCLK